jgi:hypothetical protein
MNQGPDAITAAAAAIAVLTAPHPIVAYTLTHTRDLGEGNSGGSVTHKALLSTQYSGGPGDDSKRAVVG